MADESINYIPPVVTGEKKPYSHCSDVNDAYVRRKNLSNIGVASGIYGNHLKEMVAKINKTPIEKLISNRHVNAYILIGKDRDGGVASGLGARGHSAVSSIDIVAGHMGGRPVTSYIDKRTGQTVVLEGGKDFKNDCSRIYLSEKSRNIDEYFEIPSAKIKIANNIYDLEANAGLAAAAIKSDCVRLIGRENIKIVTFHSTENALKKGNINNGVAILAGVNKIGKDPRFDPQPMVKGNNLVRCLQFMMGMIENIDASMTNFLNRQMVINNILAKHTHQSGDAGMSTSSVSERGLGIENFRYNLSELADLALRQADHVCYKMNFLNLGDANSILSSYNLVN